MRRTLGLMAGLLVLAAGAAAVRAQDGAAQGAARAPVVVELFTSQGCSSCPPADRLLRELAAREEIIALALHVDYWDYIGWRDGFARPEHTRRQKAYARVHGRRSIFTPQMIVNGEEAVVGAHPLEVAQLLMRELSEPPQARLTVTHKGGGLHIEAAPAAGAAGAAARAGAAEAAGPIDVHLVRYLPEAKVQILRGENAGLSPTYVNIVTEWTTLAHWDGRAPLSLEADLPGDLPAVVILQRAGQGPVLAAARAR